MIRVIIDVTGGDLAPQCNIDGAEEVLHKYEDLEIILAGPKSMIEAHTQSLSQFAPNRWTVLDCSDIITPDEHPVMALRKKRNSPFSLGMGMLPKGEADAFVSAGSTGALMAGAMLHAKRIHGVIRPALAAVIPVPNRPLLLIDAGANVDCSPEWLNQFALMGSVYMNKVNGIAKPEVGLLNIGVEEVKGNELSQKAYQALKTNDKIRFIGNIEARDALAGSCDVLATDGFAGNVLLKNTEGVAYLLFSLIKNEFKSSTKGKIAGLLAKDSFRRIKTSFDSTEVGGAPLLGVEGAVIKAHGNSSEHAISCAIRQAYFMAKGNVVQDIREGIQSMQV